MFSVLTGTGGDTDGSVELEPPGMCPSGLVSPSSPGTELNMGRDGGPPS